MGVGHEGRAHGPDQHSAEASVPAAAHHHQVGVPAGLDQGVPRVPLHEPGFDVGRGLPPRTPSPRSPAGFRRHGRRSRRCPWRRNRRRPAGRPSWPWRPAWPRAARRGSVPGAAPPPRHRNRQPPPRWSGCPWLRSWLIPSSCSWRVQPTMIRRAAAAARAESHGGEPHGHGPAGPRTLVRVRGREKNCSVGNEQTRGATMGRLESAGRTTAIQQRTESRQWTATRRHDLRSRLGSTAPYVAAQAAGRENHDCLGRRRSHCTRRGIRPSSVSSSSMTTNSSGAAFRNSLRARASWWWEVRVPPSRRPAGFPPLHPDVCVLDARLPDGTGIEVCRDVRSVDPVAELHHPDQFRRRTGPARRRPGRRERLCPEGDRRHRPDRGAAPGGRRRVALRGGRRCRHRGQPGGGRRG